MASQLPYLAAYLLAAVLMAAVGAYSWTRRKARGGVLLVLFCFVASYWCAVNVLLHLGLDLETAVFLTKIEYVANVVVPPLGFLMVTTIFGSPLLVGRWRVAILFAPAFLTLVAHWSNSLHYLYYTNYELSTDPFPVLQAAHGPLWYVHISYQYLLMVGIIVFLIWQVATSTPYGRRQAVVILVCILLPGIGNVIYVVGLSPVANLDTTPLTMSLVACAFAWALYRYNLLDILPVARAKVFDGLRDPVIVLDGESRIVDLNPAAEQLTGQAADSLVGSDASEALVDHSELVASLADPSARETRVHRDGREHFFEMLVTDLVDDEDKASGRLVMLHDVSARKRLENELTLLATTDELTGIANRRQLVELGVTEFARARRHGRGLSVLVLDLDHFKSVNDRHGHDIGDAVLRSIAAAFRPQLRAEDLIGRLGGEEFCAVLPDTGPAGAGEAAERLRSAASEVEIVEAPVKVTVSVGIASLSSRDDTFHDLLKRADQALYQAKSAGRDRAVAADSESPH